MENKNTAKGKYKSNVCNSNSFKHRRQSIGHTNDMELWMKFYTCTKTFRTNVLYLILCVANSTETKYCVHATPILYVLYTPSSTESDGVWDFQSVLENRLYAWIFYVHVSY